MQMPEQLQLMQESTKSFAGGVMGTHDEDTRKFFANTRVNCELFAREGAHAQDSIVGRNTTDRIFTHHQKTVRNVLTWLVIVLGVTLSAAQAAKLLVGSDGAHDILHDIAGPQHCNQSHGLMRCGGCDGKFGMIHASLARTDSGGLGARRGQPPPAGLAPADIVRRWAGPVQRAV